MDLLDQMETFVHVVETGSLSKAARARSLSLPAVSRQLRALERDLGRALIIRSTRRLRVTEAGQRWYENCARILSDLEQARREVDSPAAVRGSLTVSAPVTFGQVHVMPCVHTLLARHPDLSINVRLEDQLVDLVSEAVDVVVRGGFELPDSPSLISRPLRRFHRLAVATPAYLRRHGSPADPRALREHSCLIQLGAFGPLHDWRFTRGSEARSIQVSGRLRATSPMALLAATLAGDGIALLPEWLVDREIEARRLKRVLADWTTPLTSVWAVYRTESRAAARIKAFLDAMTVNHRGEVS
jgi:DNA-binding transcriptional LysR family regulator